MYIFAFVLKNKIIDTKKNIKLHTKIPLSEIDLNKDKTSKLKTNCANAIRVMYINPKLFFAFFEKEEPIKTDDTRTEKTERKNIASSYFINIQSP